MLTKDQIEQIKSFPEPVLQQMRKALSYLPNKKNDFNWIIKGCIAECKRLKMNIPHTLRKYGFDNAANKAQQGIRRDLQPYVYQAKYYSHEEANQQIEQILNDTSSFQAMAKLFGDQNARKYQQKLVDNIINHVKD